MRTQSDRSLATFSAITAITMMASLPALALPPGPEVGHADIELMVHQEGPVKHIESAFPIWYSVDSESSFAYRADLGGIATASPGYPGFGAGAHDHGDPHDHDHVPFDPNVTFTITPSTTLRTWNPVTGDFEATDNERVEIYKAAGPFAIYHTIVSGSAITTGSSDSDGLAFVQIGTTNSQGQLHTHVFWYLTTSSGSADFGAYLVEIIVSAPGYEDSDPIPVLFNYGLSDSQFESAIWGAAALYNIPEPTTALLLSAMGTTLLMRRQRRAVSIN